MSYVYILKENNRLSDWELFHYICMMANLDLRYHLTDYLIKTSMDFIY